LRTRAVTSWRGARLPSVPRTMAYTPVWKTHLATDTEFDPQYHQNPRPEVASFINDPPGVVLDVGCGGGATGKLIKEKFPGTRVIGVEQNPHAARYARQFLDDVVCANIDDVDLARDVGDVMIRTVLLLDVLEHLYDPWRALARIRSWIQPGTRVLASVPNIRNLANLDELAAGRWEYGPHGVLDITHVRFFTRDTLRRLFEETGYAVFHMEPLTQPAWVDRYVIARRPGKLVTQNLSIAFRNREDLEDLYAIQYVVDARASTEPYEGGATLPSNSEPSPIV
jgi:SAM-dependent methyltransferase